MEKRVQDYTQDILAVVRSNTSPAAMSDKLGDFHANDIADAMPRLNAANCTVFWNWICCPIFLSIRTQIMQQNM